MSLHWKLSPKFSIPPKTPGMRTNYYWVILRWLEKSNTNAETHLGQSGDTEKGRGITAREVSKGLAGRRKSPHPLGTYRGWGQEFQAEETLSARLVT